MRALIIEDEKLAQQELTEMLLQIDESISIVACLRSIKESINWLKTNDGNYDLIFMDIELSDGQSFEIFESIKIEKPVIFLTAYDEFALKAFKVNSIDYLLKPVNPEELVFAIEKFKKSQVQNNFSIHDIQQMLQPIQKSYKQRFTIRIGDSFRYVNVNDIAYFFAKDKSNYIITKNQKRFLLDQSLNEIEPLLDPTLFFRATRKFIISISSVTKASKYFNSRLKLELTPPSSEELLISRVKVPMFLEWMDS